jgi:hypothetical protein
LPRACAPNRAAVEGAARVLAALRDAEPTPPPAVSDAA